MIERATRDTQLPTDLRDEQLEIRIGRVLQSAGYRDLRRVRTVSRDGHVYLRGQLPSYFLKQMAQSLALTVDGVELLDNEIDVRKSDDFN